MRKETMIAASMLLLFAVSGCKKEAVLPEEPVVAEAEQQENEEASEAEAQESEVQETEESTESVQSPFVSWYIARKGSGNYNEEGIHLANDTYSQIYIDSEDYPELTKSIEQWNEEQVQYHERSFEESASAAEQDYQVRPEWWTEGTEDAVYTCDSDCAIKRADNQIFSFRENTYEYMGGAHGGSTSLGVQFDSQTGEQIVLTDVVKDIAVLPDLLEEKLLDKYDPDLFMVEDIAQGIQDNYSQFTEAAPAELQFTIGYDGITFYFNELDLACYAAGRQMVTLLYQDYPELLNAEYFENAPENYVIGLEFSNEEEIRDAAGTGLRQLFIYDSSDETDYDSIDSIMIQLGNQETEQTTHTFSVRPYYIRSNGSSFLYLQMIAESDYQSIMIFDVSGEKAEYVNEIDGSLVDFADPNHFQMENQMDLLSTYGAVRTFHVGEDGIPVNESEDYEVLDYGDGLNLVSTVELTGELIDENTQQPAGEGVFPAGTEFTFKRTDNKSYVIMKASDGRTVKFNVTAEWPQTINGMDAEECFEQLYFAS